MASIQSSVTKSDIDTIVLGIQNNEALINYLATNVDKLKYQLKVSKLIDKLAKSSISCEECENEYKYIQYTCKVCGSDFDERDIYDEYREDECKCPDTNESNIEKICTYYLYYCNKCGVTWDSECDIPLESGWKIECTCPKCTTECICPDCNIQDLSTVTKKYSYDNICKVCKKEWFKKYNPSGKFQCPGCPEGVGDIIEVNKPEPSECDNCYNIYTIFGGNAKIAEILKVFTKNFTCKLVTEYEYNDGCKYIDKYEYIFKFDDNIKLSYDYHSCRGYIKNTVNNTKYKLDRGREHRYNNDCGKSMLMNEIWEPKYCTSPIDLNIDPKLFNTTEVWSYLIQRYPNVSESKYAFLLLELVYLLMDTLTERPHDGDD